MDREAEQSVLAGGDVVLKVGETEAGGPLILGVLHHRDGDAGNMGGLINFATAASICARLSSES